MPNKTDDPRQPEQPKELKFMYNHTPYELDRLARVGDPAEEDTINRRLKERKKRLPIPHRR